MRKQKLPDDKIQFNLSSLFIVLIVAGLLAFYVGPALLNGDPLWFMPFDETPQEIIVYRGGKQLVLYPGDARFQELNTACNRALSTITSIDMLGASAATIADAKAQDTNVELLYAQPVKLKSNLGVGTASAILIPLTGRHTDRPRIYTGNHEMYAAGTPVLKDLSQVRQVVDRLQF